MPYVLIQTTRDGANADGNYITEEQKAEVFKGVSDVLERVLNKPPEWTMVVIQEVERENWGWGGMPSHIFRKTKREAATGVSD